MKLPPRLTQSTEKAGGGPKREAPPRLAVSEAIESRSKHHILPDTTLHCLGQTVFRVPAAQRESRSPLLRERVTE
jgi:hypothetical protein